MASEIGLREPFSHGGACSPNVAPLNAVQMRVIEASARARAISDDAARLGRRAERQRVRRDALVDDRAHLNGIQGCDVRRASATVGKWLAQANFACHASSFHPT